MIEKADPQPPLNEMWSEYFDTLRRVGFLKDNWDDNGAIALTENVIAKSDHFTKEALQASLPLNEICPQPNGAIKFTFVSSNIDEACIEINETTNISEVVQALKGLFE